MKNRRKSWILSIFGDLKTCTQFETLIRTSFFASFANKNYSNRLANIEIYFWNVVVPDNLLAVLRPGHWWQNRHGKQNRWLSEPLNYNNELVTYLAISWQQKKAKNPRKNLPLICQTLWQKIAFNCNKTGIIWQNCIELLLIQLPVQ